MEEEPSCMVPIIITFFVTLLIVGISLFFIYLIRDTQPYFNDLQTMFCPASSSSSCSSNSSSSSTESRIGLSYKKPENELVDELVTLQNNIIDNSVKPDVCSTLKTTFEDLSNVSSCKSFIDDSIGEIPSGLVSQYNTFKSSLSASVCNADDTINVAAMTTFSKDINKMIC